MLKNYIPNPILKAENDIKTFEHSSLASSKILRILKLI